MRKGKRLKSIAYSIGTGVFAVFLFLLFFLAANKNVAPFILILREVFPLYGENSGSVMKFYAFGGEYVAPEPEQQARQEGGYAEEAEVIPEGVDEPPQILVSEDEAVGSNAPGIVGISNVVYQPETEPGMKESPQTLMLTKADLEHLMDFSFLKDALYTIDKRTELLPEDVDVNGFLHTNLKLDKNIEGPKVIIIHTHSMEAYADSLENDLSDGIFSIGDRLAELLNTKYGIETLHDKSSYDVVNGESSTLGAYERMEESVSKILEKNPSIELVIDLHRDGVSENVHLATNVNGKPTAKLMFFNGLCRVYNKGELEPTNGLSNQFVKENLALSFNLQLLANELFPGLTRKIYVNAYRYSLHFKPKSILVEVGAQTNTKEEALNAMKPLAEILAKTVK